MSVGGFFRGGVLARRIMVSVILFSSMITVLTTAVQLYFDYRQDVGKIEDGFTFIRHHFLDSLENSVWVANEQQILLQLEGLLGLPDVEFVHVSEPGGGEWKAGLRVSDSVLERTFDLRHRHRDKDLVIGSFHVVASLDHVYGRLLDKVLLILGANAVKTFLVALFMLALVHYLVTRHLVRIGDFSHSFDIKAPFQPMSLDRPAEHKPDELDGVVEALNTRTQRLKESHDFLEEQVESRTRDLSREVTERRLAQERLAGRLRAEHLIGSVSSEFVTIGKAGIAGKLDRALRAIGETTEADRLLLFLRVPEDPKAYHLSHQWSAAAMGDDLPTGDIYSRDDLPWLLDELEVQWAVHEPRVSDLPPQAAREKALSESLGSRSFLVLPLKSTGGLEGFLALHSVRAERTWPEEDIRVLRTACEILDSALRRKRAELSLAEREGLYRTLVERTKVVSWEMDLATWRFTYVSPQAVTLFGYPVEDWYGDRFWHGIVHPDDLDEAIAFCSTQTEQGEDHEFEYRIMGADGQSVWVRDIVSVPEEGSQQQVLRGVLIDITDRKDAERELEEATERLRRSNEDLEKFAYVASHDLQEPLRMVRSYLQLLDRRYGTELDGDAREYIGFAVDGAERMSDLIRALLDYSRTTSNEVEFEPVDMGEAAGAALENLHVAVEQADGSVEIGGLPLVMGNHVQLMRLLQNLIGNGIKYRAPGRSPEVRVSAERSGADWVFVVADNGIGIADQHAEQIFQIFQRLHARGEYEGTGIGLAVCRKIVEQHGGRIWVEGVPGEGSSFFFTLPVPDGAMKGP